MHRPEVLSLLKSRVQRAVSLLPSFSNSKPKSKIAMTYSSNSVKIFFWAPLVAEFDNFKKRTIKEKENIYTDSVCDVVTEILPILDNLERALAAFENKESGEYKGVEMIQKQTLDIFAKIGVEQIEAVGASFDPQKHNAIMHIDDNTVADNIVVEEFQKGYSYKDKVIRYSMVKVAN